MCSALVWRISCNTWAYDSWFVEFAFFFLSFFLSHSSHLLQLGTLTSFILYTLTVAASVGGLSSLYGDFMKAVGASQRIFELLDRIPEVRFEEGKKLDKVCECRYIFFIVVLNRLLLGDWNGRVERYSVLLSITSRSRGVARIKFDVVSWKSRCSRWSIRWRQEHCLSSYRGLLLIVNDAFFSFFIIRFRRFIIHQVVKCCSMALMLEISIHDSSVIKLASYLKNQVFLLHV